MARQGKARVLTPDEFKRTAMVISAGTKHPKRNLAILYMSYYAAMRACEIRRLKIRDVLDANGKLLKTSILEKRVTKGNKQRDVFYSNKKLRNVLIDHIEELKEKCKKNKVPFCREDPLFMSQKGGEFLPNDMVRLICSFYKLAGIQGAKSHSGRRTRITSLLDAGYDIPAVSYIVGHSNVNTTMGYHQSNPNRLSKICEEDI